jgi:YVTN family beta-propeller protein
MRNMKRSAIVTCGAGLALAMAGVAQGAVPQNVAYVTNQGAGVTVVDLATLKPLRTVPVGKDPRGLGVTPDGRYLLTANQADGDVSVVDTESGKAVRRIAVGENTEFLRVGPDGRYAYVTYEPSSTGQAPSKAPEPPKAGADKSEPAEIAVIDLADWTVVARMKAALETEGVEFTPDGRRLVVTNEGDNTVVVYDLESRRPVQTIDVSPYGSRPRGVKVAPDGKLYIVTLENSDNFLVLDADFKVLRAVPTGQGPYGVAFEPGGKHVWIAAARSQRMQVLDAATFEPVASIPIGKRCWHFSFTPDGTKALVACGRSNALSVIDVASREVTAMPGFETPWGVVTYPKSSGSLDTASKMH